MSDKSRQSRIEYGILGGFLNMIKVLFVCHGNICRSPMSQYVLQDMVSRRHISDEFYIDSAATSREEIGNGVHYGTRGKLREEGIPCGNHKARQMTKRDYEDFDYLIGMDNANLRNMKRILGGDPDGKIYRLLDFTDRPGEIADPWYTGNFDDTYEDVKTGCEGFLKALGFSQEKWAGEMGERNGREK